MKKVELLFYLLLLITNSIQAQIQNVAPSHIYPIEDTTIVYEGIYGEKTMYEDPHLGYLDVGYQGIYGVPMEVQILLKYDLPVVPQGYEVASAQLYFPITGGVIQATASFSLKASSSLNHNWTQNQVTNATLPPSIAGSTLARSVATNAPTAKPVIGPFDFTSYISQEINRSNPRATFILSAFTAEQAEAANIRNVEHFIQSTETHMGGTERPYLIITYTPITNIEITGVSDGNFYSNNVRPYFNVGTATLNGAPYVSGTTITNEGVYTLTVTQGNQTQTVQFTIDKTAPTANVVINNGSSFTNHEYVDVKITPDPGVNDIVSMRYSVNDSPISTTKAYQSQFSIGVGSENGNKSVKVELIDAAGNTSPLYFRSFALNTTIPTGNLTINNGARHTIEQEVDILIAPDASANEIVTMQFSNDNIYWSTVESYNPSKRYTLSPGDGNKTVYVRLVDRFGNVGVLQSSILFDITPPTASVLINNGEPYANHTNVAIQITPDAGVNDIAFIKYTINGLPPTTIAYTNNFGINVGSTNGDKEITITLIDGAGYTSPDYSATVTLDTLPPTGTIAINEGAVYTTDAEVTLDFTLGTGVNDVVGIQLSNDNVSWSAQQSYSANMNYTLPTGDGNKTIYVRLIDRAGNIGSMQTSIILDTTPPTATFVINGGAAYTIDAEVTLSFTPAVNVNDIAIVQFSNDNVSWSAQQNYSASMNHTLPSSDGNKTVYVRLIDHAGHIAFAQNNIILDTTPPNAPTISLASNSDSGVIGDLITNHSSLTFTGTAENGSTVTLYNSDRITILGTTTVVNNIWSISNVQLPLGNHSISVLATDPAGNISAPSATLNLTIDFTAPEISSVSVPTNGTYTKGEKLTFTLTFSEAVFVTGIPQLTIQIGNQTVFADYIASNQLNNLNFEFIIPSNLYDDDGITIGNLRLNGGTITDVADNNAVTTLQNIGSTNLIMVNSLETDLALTVAANTPTPAVDDVATFTVTVTNNGPSQATHAIATVTLPAGLTFVSATPNLGTHNSNTGLWAIGLLAPNTSQTLTLTARVIAAGTITVSAVVTSNITDLNNANNTASSTFTVNKKTQSLTFNSLSNKTYGDANVPLVATTTSGLPITYTSSDPAIATVVPGTNGSEIKIIAVGTVTITASQLGDAIYDAASKTQPFTVDPATLSITATPQTKVYGTPDPALTYTITQGALVGNDQLSLTRLANENVGAYPITVHTFDQAANYNFTFTAAELTITKANQTLVWNQNLDLGCNSPSSLVLDAYSTSGLPITYQVANTAIANVTGNTLHYVGYGTTQITATQAGDNNHLPATAVVLQAVHLSSGLIVQKWNDVLVFNNTTNNYNAWQWFKDGQLIAGATGQYYNAPQPLSGTYYVVATDTNGNQMQTCPVTIASSKQIKKMSLTPNPVHAGNTFTVHTNRTAAEIKGARLVITDLSGKLVTQLNLVEPTIALQAPNTVSVYLVTLFLPDGKTESAKLIVH